MVTPSAFAVLSLMTSSNHRLGTRRVLSWRLSNTLMAGFAPRR